MTPHKSVKQLITETVLKEIPENLNPYPDLTIEQLLFKWWFTGRQDGLRLTEDGMIAFKLAQIVGYEIDFKVGAKSYYELMLELSRKIKCPYYLNVNKVTRTPYMKLYDSKIVTMINLYGGLQEYLNLARIR